MNQRDVLTLLDYGYWANRKLLDVAAAIDPIDFTKMVAGSYGSLRNTFVHILSAEAGWLERAGGPKRGPRLVAEDFPDVASIRHRWSTVESQMLGFLAGLQDDDMSRIVEFTLDGFGSFALRLDELFRHVANHGTHHRGQVALLLRMLGHSPGNVDMLFYFAERRR